MTKSQMGKEKNLVLQFTIIIHKNYIIIQPCSANLPLYYRLILPLHFQILCYCQCKNQIIIIM